MKIKIPSTLKIGSHTIEVVELPGKHFSDNQQRVGWSDEETLVIGIKKELVASQKDVAFLHEVLHLGIGFGGLGEILTEAREEMVVQALAEVLAQVIPQIVEAHGFEAKDKESKVPWLPQMMK